MGGRGVHWTGYTCPSDIFTKNCCHSRTIHHCENIRTSVRATGRSHEIALPIPDLFTPVENFTFTE